MTAQHPRRAGVPRLVVDPGVYVSAALGGRGAPTKVLDLALEGRVVLVLSDLVLAELSEVLGREKFRRYISSEASERFVRALVLVADHVEDPPESTWPRVCRDPKDDYLIALAEAAGTSLLVSGDGDLLTVERPGLDVRTPRAAVDAVRAWTATGDG